MSSRFRVVLGALSAPSPSHLFSQLPTSSPTTTPPCLRHHPRHHPVTPTPHFISCIMGGYSQFTSNYFSSRKPNAWAFLSFATEFSQQYPTITFGEANSRFLNALQKITASPSFSAPARSKAQSLIDTLKNRSVSPLTSPPLLSITPALGCRPVSTGTLGATPQRQSVSLVDCCIAARSQLI